MTPECNNSHLLNSSKKEKVVEVTESKYSEHSLVTLCVIYGTANICVWISVQTGYKEGFSPIKNSRAAGGGWPTHWSNADGLK